MFLKKNPFIRLLVPFITGIIIQWYLQLPLLYGLLLFVSSGILYSFFNLFKGFRRFRYSPLQGACILLALIAAGMMITFIKDARHQKRSLTKTYHQDEVVIATLQEPLTEKENAYKAAALVTNIIKEGKSRPASGKVMLYFKKDSINARLGAGYTILFANALQEVRNPGNPGAFDYKRYALFNGITHQVFLTSADYRILSTGHLPFWKALLLKAKNFVLTAIQTNIKGKKEQGLAEAILIGYKSDLDKSLLQSYTNTGVVHVIAVSGMHLALLYWIIHLLLAPLLKRKPTRWLYPALVLFILWGFSFLTGGAASVIRAAIMFTFITIGKLFNRNASVYNILAASAFCQLCYNPYWLWDIGFQLSYAAVLSIVIFYKPVYDLLWVQNKALDRVWRLAAVSIAAQILTTPLSMYYFHQFPVYFLLSNLVVVPVSTCVLTGTLLLVIFFPVKIIAGFSGYLLNGLIGWLNTFIERMESFAFALWQGIQINAWQAALFLCIITGTSLWLLKKHKTGVWMALSGLLLFFSIRSYSFYKAAQQQRMIVYNVSKHTIADFISGRNYVSIADSEAFYNPAVNNYILKPSRTMQRITAANALPGFYKHNNAILFHNKKILFVNSPLSTAETNGPVAADVVILTGNAVLHISTLLKYVTPRQIVIDGSVPTWKARYWVKDCNSLKISCHNVADSGAFVMNLY